MDITLFCTSPQWQSSQCSPVYFSGSSFTLTCLIFLRGWKSGTVSCGESAIFTGSATAVLTKLLAGSAQGTFVQVLTLLALDCATLDPSGWQVALTTPLSLHWRAIGLKQPYNCEQILISWTCAPWTVVIVSTICMQRLNVQMATNLSWCKAMISLIKRCSGKAR